jgi:DNA-binding XRE family transcriptional regulator
VALPQLRVPRKGKEAASVILAFWAKTKGEKLTEETIDRVKRLYTIIRDGALPDSELGERVNIVRELERLTSCDFKDTADFHRKVSSFLARKDNNGIRLREARKSRGWPLSTMGVHLGVSKQFVAQMESGRKPLSDKALAFLSSTRGSAV